MLFIRLQSWRNFFTFDLASSADLEKFSQLKRTPTLSKVIHGMRKGTGMNRVNKRVERVERVERIERVDLMGMVGNDLRNLLAGMAIHAKVAANEAAVSPGGKKTILGMDRIAHYVACLNRLIGDLVDLTSIDAGKAAMHPLPGDFTSRFQPQAMPSLCPRIACQNFLTGVNTTGQPRPLLNRCRPFKDGAVVLPFLQLCWF